MGEEGLIIIGERINSSRKSVLAALQTKDTSLICREAVAQAEAGADYIDVNAAARLKEEACDLEWLVRTVQEATGLPLCLDSPNPQALEAGLRAHRGKAILNSFTADPARAGAVLSLAAQYGAAVIGLTMDEGSLPRTWAERLRLARTLAEMAGEAGIEPQDTYIDPLVRCVSAEPEQALEALRAMAAIKAELPGVGLVCGLSNVSYGLPSRGLLNRTFLSMALSQGLDAAILDPLDRGLMATLKAARALLGHDPYCLDFIAAHRGGLLGE